jgi:protein-tyrosine phosphatase
MRDELEEYDYVLAMDKSNLTNILRFGEPENTEIALFLSYALQNGTINVDEVPDPYFTNNFDYTYELVHKGSQALLDHIRQSESI